MPLREKTYRKKEVNTHFFKLVSGTYFHGVSFEELEERYFECKKEKEELEKEELEKGTK